MGGREAEAVAELRQRQQRGPGSLAIASQRSDAVNPPSASRPTARSGPANQRPASPKKVVSETTPSAQNAPTKASEWPSRAQCSEPNVLRSAWLAWISVAAPITRNSKPRRRPPDCAASAGAGACARAPSGAAWSAAPTDISDAAASP